MLKFAPSLAAIGTLAAAVYAAVSARYSRKALTANQLNGILDLRYSVEMLRARKGLHDRFRECHAEGKDFGEEFIRLRNSSEGEDMDVKRRCLETYYQKIHLEWANRFLPRRALKVLVNSGEVRSFFRIFWPLERALAEDICKKEKFDSRSDKLPPSQPTGIDDEMYVFYSCLREHFEDRTPLLWVLHKYRRVVRVRGTEHRLLDSR